MSIRNLLQNDHNIERVQAIESYPKGDLPYLEFLLNQSNDLNYVKSEIYKYHERNGNLQQALQAEKMLKRGLDYAKQVFPEIKDYIKEQLHLLGYHNLKEDADIKDSEVIPIRLPSVSVEGAEKVDGEIKEYKEFAGAAAGVTPIYVFKQKAGQKYLMMANLPLADLPEKQVKTIGLHEFIHTYLSELGITEEEQKRLEPYIDRWMIDFYKSRGEYETAEQILQHSGYLNSQKEQPWYIV